MKIVLYIINGFFVVSGTPSAFELRCVQAHRRATGRHRFSRICDSFGLPYVLVAFTYRVRGSLVFAVRRPRSGSGTLNAYDNSRPNTRVSGIEKEHWT